MAIKGTAIAHPVGPSSDEPRTRRSMLAMMGAGGAAAAAATLASSDPAYAGHDSTNVLHLGASNTAPPGQETEVAANVEGFGLRVDNNGASGADAASGAIQGHSDAGVAGRFTTTTGESLHCDGRASVFGDVEDNLVTVGNGHSAGNGFSAGAHGQYAVEGVHLGSDPQPGQAGVVGVSGEGEDYGEGPGTGVLGSSGTGVGVSGFSPSTGAGVRGESAEGIGVDALSESGIALHVSGKAAFGTAGLAEVAPGNSSVFVNQIVTADSHVTVTPVSDPNGLHVAWIERDPGSGFTVHLSGRVRTKGPALALTYLVVEPG